MRAFVLSIAGSDICIVFINDINISVPSFRNHLLHIIGDDGDLIIQMLIITNTDDEHWLVKISTAIMTVRITKTIMNGNYHAVLFEVVIDFGKMDDLSAPEFLPKIVISPVDMDPVDQTVSAFFYIQNSSSRILDMKFGLCKFTG